MKKKPQKNIIKKRSSITWLSIKKSWKSDVLKRKEFIIYEELKVVKRKRKCQVNLILWEKIFSSVRKSVEKLNPWDLSNDQQKRDWS